MGRPIEALQMEWLPLFSILFLTDLGCGFSVIETGRALILLIGIGILVGCLVAVAHIVVFCTVTQELSVLIAGITGAACSSQRQQAKHQCGSHGSSEVGAHDTAQALFWEPSNTNSSQNLANPAQGSNEGVRFGPTGKGVSV